MASPELYILDVGHGNCALIRHGDEVIIVDAPEGGIVIDALEALGIRKIKSLIISHADADHLSGAISLVLDAGRPIERVYVNSDSTKRGRVWEDFRRAVRAAKGRVAVSRNLDTSLAGTIKCGDVDVDVVFPEPELALGGAGSTDIEGRELNSNTSSAVVKLSHSGSPICLLTGDIDAVSLANLQQDNVDLRAKILIFPHHGGRPGTASPGDFATSLLQAVSPDVVILSLGRGRHQTPRPDIIHAIKATTPAAHIACTQLSARCSDTLPSGPFPHLNGLPAKGARQRACCAGTFQIQLDGNNTTNLMQSHLAAHRAFVIKNIPGGLCR